MNKQFSKFLIISMAIVIYGCPPGECVSPNRSYLAQHSFEVKNSIFVGDTIWFNSSMDCEQMFNQITSSFEQFCGHTFSFTLGLTHFEGNTSEGNFGPALDRFEFITIQGKIYNDRNIPSPDHFNQVQFEQINNFYKLQFGLVCQEKGNYIFSLRPGGASNAKHCDRASLDNIITNEERGQDMYIAFRHPQEVTDHDLRNIYCFEVR